MGKSELKAAFEVSIWVGIPACLWLLWNILDGDAIFAWPLTLLSVVAIFVVVGEFREWVAWSRSKSGQA